MPSEVGGSVFIIFYSADPTKEALTLPPLGLHFLQPIFSVSYLSVSTVLVRIYTMCLIPSCYVPGSMVRCVSFRSGSFTVASLLDHLDWMPSEVRFHRRKKKRKHRSTIPS